MDVRTPKYSFLDSLPVSGREPETPDAGRGHSPLEPEPSFTEYRVYKVYWHILVDLISNIHHLGSLQLHDRQCDRSF